MPRTLRLLATAGLLLFVTHLAAASASAADYAGLSPGGAITARSLGALTFTTTGFIATCSVSLSGRLDTSIQMPDGQFGSITSGAPSGCSGLTSPSLLFATAWPVRFADVLGGFPDDLAGVVIALDNVAVSGTVGGLSCLWQGRIELLTTVRGPAPYALGLFTVARTSRLALVRGAICPSSVSVTGAVAVTAMTFAPPRIPKHLVPDDSIVRFHNPVIANHQFTFTRKAAGAVTGISAFMQEGDKGFRVPATECNGAIPQNNSCTATVTADPPLLSWDLVQIVDGTPAILGGAWVVP